jgi:hypothetical protein
MKNWKVKIEYKNKTMEIILQANTYSEAYIAAEMKYAGCVVKSVSEIRKNAVD